MALHGQAIETSYSQPPAMADDNFASASTTTINAGAASPARDDNAPSSGFGFRRAATFGQPPALRRRLNGANPPTAAENNTFANLRRRSSTYSDFLEAGADDLLHPSRSTTENEQHKSPYVYIPLTLALLPAIAGVFFENGAPFFTDLIILSLAAVFLHWSVTQPWDWYHSAQQIRVLQDDILSDSVFESDSDFETAPLSPTTSLDKVPEEKGKEPESSEAETQAAGSYDSRRVDRNARWEARQRAAVKELHVHEIMALAWCFVFPMLGAYLLHTIRGQLSRPSEGLVSDYNLTIFLCAAEVRPISHLIRMLQQRTLHIQTVVAQNPHTENLVTSDQLQALYDRIESLEARKDAPTTNGNTSPVQQPDVSQRAVESAVGREFRKTAQPELDALNRAMRRYEKKLTLLASHTDHKMEYVEYRLNDALALAAVAAKNSYSQWGLTGWLATKTLSVAVLPIQAVGAVLAFPIRTASTLFRWKERPPPEKTHRSATRNGKTPSGQSRGGPDRVPARVARR
ncbi:hypothetical protein F4808DRAFT_420106 [Astrocystis sublimbata]|nr:hypothetical protein F4808DRAFT_420106 [Astrocystis sublimbata]